MNASLPASNLPRSSRSRRGLTLGLGVLVGLLGASSRAEALSCDDGVYEHLAVELASVERDGELLVPADYAAIAATWIEDIYAERSGLALLGADTGDDAAWVVEQMAIEPTAEVAEYIADSEARTSGGMLCSGLPFVAARPGIYALDSSGVDDSSGWPEGATATLDAARETLLVEFVGPEGSFAIEYEVVDFEFPGESGGCSVVDDRSPAPWGLALLLVLGLARRTRVRLG